MKIRSILALTFPSLIAASALFAAAQSTPVSDDAIKADPFWARQ